MRRFYVVLRNPETKSQKVAKRKDVIKEYHRQMMKARKP